MSYQWLWSPNLAGEISASGGEDDPSQLRAGTNAGGIDRGPAEIAKEG